MIILLNLDDDKAHQEWICAQIAEKAEDITIKKAASYEEALSILNNEVIDCILSDDQMHDRAGVQLWDRLRQSDSQIPFVMLSEVSPRDKRGNEVIVIENDDYSAVAVFGNIEQIVQSVRRLVINFRGAKPIPSAGIATNRRLPGDKKLGDQLMSTLTGREKEVLMLLADGKANKEIAFDLGISYNTVVNHVRNIFSKLGIHSRSEAMHLVFRKSPQAKNRS